MNKLKPIEVDAYFKYQCNNKNCGYYHWLSLKETQTKKFKIVCDCGQIFKPKQINKIKIAYSSQTKKVQSKPSQTIDVDLSEKCVRLLVSYGFSDREAMSMIDKAFQKQPTNNASSLVKYIIQNLGEFNVNC